MKTNAGFAVGALAGAALGAGLVMLMAPRAAAEARRAVADSARALGEATADGYKEARKHVASAINDVTALGQDVRRDVADSAPPFRQL